MADIDCEFKFVPRHATALAGRRAVLKPLCHDYDLVKDAHVITAVRRVVKLWRDRCNELRDAGWKPAETIKWQYMRNCPPTCVGLAPSPTRGIPRACEKHLVCPWCWDRLVVKRTCDVVFAAMDRAGLLFLPGAKDPPADPRYKLVLRVDRWDAADGPEQPRLAYDMIAARFARDRRKADGLAAGWAQFGVVWPRTAGGWGVSVRTLALVPVEYPTAESTAVVHRPTRRAVAAAVGRFARYPAGLMFAPADQLIRMLDDRAGVRMFRSGGVFYGSDRDGEVDPVG